MRSLKEIIVHCTATTPTWWATNTAAEKVAEVRRWHMTPPHNWSDIGYHYLIDRDGSVVDGRPLGKIGAHVKGHNTGSIGISLFGGFGSSEKDAFADNFTVAQAISLRRLIAKLRLEFPTISKVSGHNEYAAKACPGFTVATWLAKQPETNPEPKPAAKPLITERKSPAESKTMQASVIAAGSAVGTAGTAIAAFDSTAQYIVLAFAGVSLLMVLWIMRERLRKWAAGDR